MNGVSSFIEFFRHFLSLYNNTKIDTNISFIYIQNNVTKKGRNNKFETEKNKRFNYITISGYEALL